MRLKNLSPDILNNNMMMEFEHMARTKAEENQGNFMIFEVSDCKGKNIGNERDNIDEAEGI